jgi:hypothetical protein
VTRRVINLDERLATARAEAGDSIERIITWRGTEWKLPDDLPLAFAEHTEARRLTEALVSVLGEKVRGLGVGFAEADLLVAAIAEQFGISPGESSASA